MELKMLSYIITFFLDYFLCWCSLICISVCEWQLSLDKGCHVQEAVRFGGENTGPEIVIPIKPLAYQVPLNEPQDCSWASFTH